MRLLRLASACALAALGSACGDESSSDASSGGGAAGTSTASSASTAGGGSSSSTSTTTSSGAAVDDGIPGGGVVLLEEHFDDGDFAGRGWYDEPGGAISPDAAPGSTSSFLCEVRTDDDYCRDGSPGFHAVPPTETLYLRFWLRLSESWYFRAAGDSTGMIALMTDPDDSADPLRTPVTLRATALDGRATLAAGGQKWEALGAFVDAEGPHFKADWHEVEIYVAMNSLAGGAGVADGRVRWVQDGEVLVAADDAVIRHNEHESPQFDEVSIRTVFGGGAPTSQSFQIDELVVATARP